MNKIVSSLGLIGLLFFTACGGTADTTDISQAVQDTVVALAIQQTLTAAASGGGEVATNTPGELVPVSTVPMVSVSVATNCRTGPGEPYDIVGALAVGQQAEVIGRNQSGDTWIIRLPSNPSVTCWLWGYYATVTGDTAGLMVYTPPPTPTPSVGFTVAYSYVIVCPWDEFHLRFQFTNTGTETWHSFAISVTDSSTAESKYGSFDGFIDGTPGCLVTGSWEEITPGESAAVGNWGDSHFDYNPTGHNMSATFRLCTEDGLAGTCAERSIAFTP